MDKDGYDKKVKVNSSEILSIINSFDAEVARHFSAVRNTSKRGKVNQMYTY